jgi:hypothetical protein
MKTKRHTRKTVGEARARTSRAVGWVVAIAVALSTAACAAPRVVSGITSSRDQIKFLYQEGDSQGVIKCKVATDGSLSDCHHMAVVTQD